MAINGANRSFENSEEVNIPLPERKESLSNIKVGIISSVLAVFITVIALLYFLHTKSYINSTFAVVSGDNIPVRTQLSGTISDVFVSEQQQVRAKDLLVELEAVDYQGRLKEQRTKLAAASEAFSELRQNLNQKELRVKDFQKKLDVASSQLFKAEKEYTKFVEMYKEGIISKQDYDNNLKLLTNSQTNKLNAEEQLKTAVSEVESVKKAISSQEILIQQLNSDLRKVESDISSTKLYSPEDGIVSSVLVAKGDSVQQGDAVLSIITGKMWVMAAFDAQKAKNIKPEMKALITLKTFPKNTIVGHVDLIIPENEAALVTADIPDFVSQIPQADGVVIVKILFNDSVEKYNLLPGNAVSAKVKFK